MEDSLNLRSRFAEITILVGTVIPIWGTLSMTEAIAIKATMATKFKYVGGINDYFFGDILFMANLGFATVSALGMFQLGSLQLDIMFFSGQWIETEGVIQIFWPIFVFVIFLVTGISGLVLIFKKNVEERKDQRILNNICVNLDKKCDRVREINNIKFNQPILKNIEIFVLGLIIIATFVVFMILEWMKSMNFIWFVLAMIFFINIVVPCNGLRKQDHFNAFFWRTLNDILSDYCHGFFKGLFRCGRKTQTITKPTEINLVAEVNALPMPTAYPTVCQLLQEIPYLEDTADDVPAKTSTDVLVDDRGMSMCAEETRTVNKPTYIFVAEVNTINSRPAHRTVALFIQELPPIEDPDDNISESSTNASLNALVDVIVNKEADGALSPFLQGMPSLEDTADDVPTKTSTDVPVDVGGTSMCEEETGTDDKPSYIFVAEVNDNNSPPAHRRVAPFIQELPPIEDPDDNISESSTNVSVNALADVIVHQEAEG